MPILAYPARTALLKKNYFIDVPIMSTTLYKKISFLLI